MLKGYLAVMFIGSFGCAARMWLSNLLAEKYGEEFPVGTLAANTLGCLFIGLFAGITRPDGLTGVVPDRRVDRAGYRPALRIVPD